jgi:hypothetical protein
MGWQTLSANLRRWDGGAPSRELEAAVEEVLTSSNDEEALQMFSEALDPSLQRGTDFLRRLATTEGAKCRCDAVWYGDTIAYGCKTCGLSSASCICVFCFDAGDHEGHDFYISRSDYGCCDCGDAYAWRKSGFCRHHPGPRKEVDSAQLLPEPTSRRARLLIPAQVRRLVQFQPGYSSSSGSSAAPIADNASSPDSLSATASLAAEAHSPTSSVAEFARRGVGAPSATPSEDLSPSAIDAVVPGVTGQPVRVLVTGVNLRVSEDNLREYFAARTAEGSGAGGTPEAAILRVELVRDAETKASKGRAYITLRDVGVLAAVRRTHGEVLRGNTLCVHVGDEAIVAAEQHLHAWEMHFEWLLRLGGFHDGLRRIIGQVFLDDKLIGEKSAVEVVLRHSHLMEPSVRKLETNLMVDLMLDLDFKHRFAQAVGRSGIADRRTQTSLVTSHVRFSRGRMSL